MAISKRAKIARFFRRAPNQIIADAVPVATAVYFAFKKMFDLSLETVSDRWFKPAFTDMAIGLGIGIILYACLIKISLIVLDKLSSYAGYNGEVSLLFKILRRINLEIEHHIADITDKNFTWTNLADFHPYDENIEQTLSDLHTHILHSFKKNDLNKTDVFISYYHYAGSEMPATTPECLDLLAHADQSCCDVETKRLCVNEPAHRDYLGVRAFMRKQVVFDLKAHKNKYVIGDCERRKGIRHYIGIPLVVKDVTLGLINIEFHNKVVFADLDAMRAFFRDVLYGYRCQFEYQLNKRVFFKLVQTKGPAI